MNATGAHSEAVKEDIQKRLRRIEGQVRGVQRMIAVDRDCHEIVQQLNAINSAVNNTTRLFMGAYAKDCLMDAGLQEGQEVERIVDELVGLMAKVK